MAFVPTPHITGAPSISSASSILLASAGMMLSNLPQEAQLANTISMVRGGGGGGRGNEKQQNKTFIEEFRDIQRFFILPIGLFASFLTCLFSLLMEGEVDNVLVATFFTGGFLTAVGTIIGTIFNKWSFLLPGLVIFSTGVIFNSVVNG